MNAARFLMDEELRRVRQKLLALSERAQQEGYPLRWFEELYTEANRDSGEIPWAAMTPNIAMVEWLANRPDITGKALVVGCGLGDDAEWLSAVGFETTAFDISPSCIQWCKDRFPNTNVEYRVENLLDPPSEWNDMYDLVVEIHILQAIPDSIRDSAANQLPRLLSSNGHLLCIGRLSTSNIPDEPPPPWPLTRTWLQSRFNSLTNIVFRNFVKEETPSIDRYIAVWTRN